MLSNLNTDTFTIINQIPQSASVPTKRTWTKYELDKSDKKDGIYDKSSGTMTYQANTFTAYISDWQHYKKPTWFDGGFYALPDEEKKNYYTANVGDLIVFSKIPDEVPTSSAEFNALVNKYKDIGGIISGVNVFINYKSDGTAWKTNHIEIIKG